MMVCLIVKLLKEETTVRISKPIFVVSTILVFLLVLAACDEDDGIDLSGGLQDAGQEEEAGDVEESEEEAPPEIAFVPLPPERQPVEIETSDGRMLEGYYYPAKVDNAPVIVMMHWAVGNMDEDWYYLAPWLQNRQDEMASGKRAPGLARLPYQVPWQDPSWFPPLPPEVSFAVLTFNFGGWGNSPSGSAEDGLLEDATSALRFAATLEGVDPDRISTLGASIGADGAVDACYQFNLEEIGRCVGAYSLSPGEFITGVFKYAEAAAALIEAGYPVWCLTGIADPSSETCFSGSGDLYRIFTFPGGDHGMTLVSPDHKPFEAADVNTLELYLQFLEEVYGIALTN
jgi:dienelactone hydrolase